LKNGGSDNRQHSIGINGAEGGINAPTVFNSGFNFVQFWDGRAATLEDQIDGPVTNPKEMGSSWTQVLGKLGQDEQYRADFRRVYREDISALNIKDAIAIFERSLTTPNSRFDKYLRGEMSAISPAELNGYNLFKSYGCISCHQGVNLGGNMYERMGLMADYFGDRGGSTEADNCRYNVTHRDSDRNYFRVPSLRNVAVTAPYFHDGYAKTLPDAVKMMAKYQLGRSMPENELQNIVQFLKSLTGEFEGEAL
jgi:cytochrome c peroxidase